MSQLPFLSLFEILPSLYQEEYGSRIAFLGVGERLCSLLTNAYTLPPSLRDGMNLFVGVSETFISFRSYFLLCLFLSFFADDFFFGRKLFS